MIESINVEEILEDGTRRTIESDAKFGRHSFLFSFNSLIDLDYTILRMIRNEYNNPKYIDQKVMSVSTKDIKTLLLNRQDPNPLTICIEDKSIADNIYKEIMNERYSDLICPNKYLDITGLFFLVSVYTNMKDVDVTVLCTSNQESAIIKQYHSKVKTIILPDPVDLDLDVYTDFVFKNAMDVYKFKNPFKEKRIVFLNYRFNATITEDGELFPRLDIAKDLYSNGLNAVTLVDTYRKGDPDYTDLKIVIKKKPTNN